MALSLADARKELFKLAKKADGPAEAMVKFRTFVKRHPSHLLSAHYVWRESYKGDFQMMLTERWVVEGTDKNGEPFLDDGGRHGLTENEAWHTADKMNARGADVKVLREVFNGPGARWDRAND